MFVNTLPADGKYPVRDCENLRFPIEMELSYKQKLFFLNFLFHLLNIRQFLNIFEKKMLVRAHVFPGLETVKTWLDHSLKSAVSEHPFAVNMLKDPKHL